MTSIPGTAEPDRLYHDPALAQFYDLENTFADEDDPCRALAAAANSVLDLGCGTGRLTVTLVDGKTEVVGVDPAAAMLDVARAKPGGGAVEWIQGDARALRLNRRFDLVLLTGHAFQVFLTSADQVAVLRTIAAHLSPGGRFIFDSRNPRVESWRAWTHEKTLQTLTHPEFGDVEGWHTVSHRPETFVATYETHYRAQAAARTFSAISHIRFAPQEELAKSVAEAGLSADHWYGDWRCSPFTAASPEIIPLGRLAR